MDKPKITADLGNVFSHFQKVQQEVIASDRQDKQNGNAPPPREVRHPMHVKGPRKKKEEVRVEPAAPLPPSVEKLPCEILFAAIRDGDKATIIGTMEKYHIPADASLDSKYGNPESLLQRAAHAEKMDSVAAILSVALQNTRQWANLMNAKRAIDGDTILHDLAAAVPKDDRSSTELVAGEWNPKALLYQLIENNANPLIKNTAGQRPADVAVNEEVKAYLQRVHKEEVDFTRRWQEKVRPGVINVEPLSAKKPEDKKLRIVRPRAQSDDLPSQKTR